MLEKLNTPEELRLFLKRHKAAHDQRSAWIAADQARVDKAREENDADMANVERAITARLAELEAAKAVAAS